MKHILSFLLLLVATGLGAQNVVGAEYGFGLTGFALWDDGVPFPGINPNISLRLGGTASNTAAWGERQRIDSRSGDRAVVIESDAGGTTRFTSPAQDFNDVADIYVSFHQYYRRGGGPTNPNNISVELYDDNTLLRTIPLEAQLVTGAETSPSDTVLIHAPELAGLERARIALVSEGASYFWLVDDVTFFDGAPYPRSNPSTISDTLFANGYPFDMGPDDWPYVPNQMIVQYTEALEADEEEELAAEVGARIVEQCACGTIAIWEVDGSQFTAQQQGGDLILEPAGTTNIFSNIMNAKAKTKIREAEPNDYNNTLLDSLKLLVPPAQPLTNDSLIGIAQSQPDAFRIAILDTGLDYQHDSIRDYVRIQNETFNGGIDANGNCLDDDPIGWNFVDSLNNPYDDNGHGTHVAGILIDSLMVRGGDNCDYEIIPYKTHDCNGISTLYNVVCGTYQAIIDDVDLINDSWGFYGDPSAILRNAIDSAAFQDILVISAAGNDTINLDDRQSYPACYTADNVINVGSVDSIGPNGIQDYDLAGFSNFSNTYIDVLAPGTGITSTVPGNLYQQKSGTSMSAPMVTAALARMICCLDLGQGQRPAFQEAKSTFLNRCTTLPRLPPYAENGRFLTYDAVCSPVVPVAPELEREAFRFEVSPNPFVQELAITAKGTHPGGSVSLLDANGREVFANNVSAWQAGAPYRLILPELPPGVYFLRINSKQHLWTGKLLRF